MSGRRGRGWLSGRTMARCGLRMMPPFPSSPLYAARRVFPVTAGRLAIRRDLPVTSNSLSLLPAYTGRRSVCLRPSCFSVDLPKVGSVDAMYCTAMQWVAPLTPGVLAPDWLCCPIHHHLVDPIRPARGHIPTYSSTYMGCLSCAGAPRPPASGSGLSLHIPCWHAIP